MGPRKALEGESLRGRKIDDSPRQTVIHLFSLIIMTATPVSRSMEIQMVLAWNTFDRIPPTPAPMAKIRIMPKK
jgi:hypothetical protein